MIPARPVPQVTGAPADISAVYRRTIDLPLVSQIADNPAPCASPCVCSGPANDRVLELAEYPICPRCGGHARLRDPYFALDPTPSRSTYELRQADLRISPTGYPLLNLDIPRPPPGVNR